jgi:hypothetical protein
MVTKVRHTVISDDGGILYMVPDPLFPNTSQPDISVIDSSQLYDIATKWVYNGKVYHYAYAAGTIGGNMGAKIKDPQLVSQETVGAAAAIYATQLTITLDTTDGTDYDGNIAANYLKGGNVVVFVTAGATYTFVRGILRNTAVTGSAGGTSVLTLDAPIPVAVDAAAVAEADASPWAAIVPNTGTKLQDNLVSCCGVPTVRLTSGHWGWVQTWGPCWISPAASLGDNTTSNRGAWFQGDASLADGAATDTHGLQQYAGWVMNNDKGAGQGAPFVYLQIAR